MWNFSGPQPLAQCKSFDSQLQGLTAEGLSLSSETHSVLPFSLKRVRTSLTDSLCRSRKLILLIYFQGLKEYFDCMEITDIAVSQAGCLFSQRHIYYLWTYAFCPKQNSVKAKSLTVILKRYWFFKMWIIKSLKFLEEIIKSMLNYYGKAREH